MTTRESKQLQKELLQNIQKITNTYYTDHTGKSSNVPYLYKTIYHKLSTKITKTGCMSGMKMGLFVSAAFEIKANGELSPYISSELPYRIRVREIHIGCCNSSTKCVFTYNTDDINALVKNILHVEKLYQF